MWLTYLQVAGAGLSLGYLVYILWADWNYVKEK